MLAFCLVLVLVFVQDLSAQVSSSNSEAALTEITPELIEASQSATPDAVSRVTIKYWNITDILTPFRIPAVRGDRTVLSISQRFTLPTESGLLDSIRMEFDTCDGRKIMLVVTRDSVSNSISTGLPYHYLQMNETGTIWAATLTMTGFKGKRHFAMKIPIPHVAVPKDFHIILNTMRAAGGNDSSMFAIYGAAHFNRAASLDTSRSGIVWTDSTKMLWADMFDGFFEMNGEPFGFDLMMDAIVDIGQSSVHAERSQRSALYPNPVQPNAAIRIQDESEITSVTIRNMAGSEVFGWRGASTNLELPLTGLGRGIYTTLIRTGKGARSEKLVVH